MQWLQFALCTSKWCTACSATKKTYHKIRDNVAPGSGQLFRNGCWCVAHTQSKPAAGNLAVHWRRTDGKTVTESRMNEFSGSHLKAVLCQQLFGAAVTAMWIPVYWRTSSKQKRPLLTSADSIYLSLFQSLCVSVSIKLDFYSTFITS